MTRDEAARLLMALHGNWPNTPMDDAVTLTWYSAVFERLDFETGLAVVTRLVETEERFPTIARFNEIRRAVQRRQAESHEPKQIVEGILTGDKRQRMALITRLIATETPGCGDLTKPRLIPREDRVHHLGESVANCSFCQERLRLTDEQLEERLRAAGIA